MGTYRNDAAIPFYSSTAWQNARSLCMSRSGGLCECCLKRGVITAAELVHHITPLNAGNITDASLALGQDNLMAVCRQCHGELHNKRRWKVDAQGNLI